MAPRYSHTDAMTQPRDGSGMSTRQQASMQRASRNHTRKSRRSTRLSRLDSSVRHESGRSISRSRSRESNDSDDEIDYWEPWGRAFDFSVDGTMLRHLDYSCSTPLQPKTIRIVVIDDHDITPEEEEVSPCDRDLAQCEGCSGTEQINSSTSAAPDSALAANVSNLPRSPSSVAPGSGLPAAAGDTRISSNLKRVACLGLPPSGTLPDQSRSASMESSSRRQRVGSFLSLHSNSSVSHSLAEPPAMIDITKLFELWDRKSASPTMDIRAWKMFDAESKLEKPQSDDWKGFRVGNSFRHGSKIMLHGKTHRVISVPNTVQILRKPDDNSFVVHIRCLVPEHRHYDTCSPLGEHLRDLLCSQFSAMTLYDGHSEIGIRLVTFDILDAMLENTLAFLEILRNKTTWRRRDFLNAKRVVDQVPLPSDLDRIAEYARLVRDLAQAVDLNTQSIRLYSSSMDAEKLISLNNLILRSEMRCQRLRCLMSDVQASIEAVTTQVEKVTAQSEQASIKLLTYISAIFLPLTAACSLLSMSNRVTTIGAIWWDWLCIVAVISFVVVQGYRLTLGAHNLGREPLFRRLAQLYRKARKETLEANEMKEDDHILPALPRYLYTVSKFTLPLAIAGALLVGVFSNIGLGAQILGYSIAGAVGLMTGGVLLWRVQQFVLVLRTCCVLAWAAFQLFRDSRNRPRSSESDTTQKNRPTSWLSFLKQAIIATFKCWIWCLQCCCLTSVDDDSSEKRRPGTSNGVSASTDAAPQEIRRNKKKPLRRRFAAKRVFVVLPLSALLGAISSILGLIFGKLLFQILWRMMYDIFLDNLSFKHFKKMAKDFFATLREDDDSFTEDADSRRRRRRRRRSWGDDDIEAAGEYTAQNIPPMTEEQKKRKEKSSKGFKRSSTFGGPERVGTARRELTGRVPRRQRTA